MTNDLKSPNCKKFDKVAAPTTNIFHSDAGSSTQNWTRNTSRPSRSLSDQLAAKTCLKIWKNEIWESLKVCYHFDPLESHMVTAGKTQLGHHRQPGLPRGHIDPCRSNIFFLNLVARGPKQLCNPKQKPEIFSDRAIRPVCS